MKSRIYLGLVLTLIISMLSFSHSFAQESNDDVPKKSLPACLAFAYATPEDARRNGSGPHKCFESIEKVREYMNNRNMQSGGSNLLGVLYEHTNRTGLSYSVYASSGASCQSAYLGDLGPTGFDNITSSIDNGCHAMWLWDNAFFSGTNDTFGNGITNYIGNTMNDKTTSVSFHN